MKRQYTITRDQLNALRLVIKSTGYTLPEGDSGPLSYKSLPGEIEGTFEYTEPVLTLTITKKPFLLPVKVIWGEIDEHVEDAGGSVVS